MATAYLRTKSSSVSKINDEEPLSQQHAKPKPAAGSLFTTMVLYLHAISGGFVLIHGLWLCALVLWHTATRGRLPQPETNWIVPALALTTALRDATGVRLAAKYRKGAMARIFTAGAYSTSINIILIWSYDPTFPKNPVLVGALRVLACLLAAANVWVAAADMSVRVFSPNGMLALRRGKQSERAGAGWAAEAITGTFGLLSVLCYAVPTIGPMLMINLACVPFIVGGSKVRVYVLERWPYFSEALCMAVIGNWAGGVVLFAVTLRDRRFISRSVEIAACGTPFAIYVLVVVYLLIKYDDAFNLFSLFANPVAILRAAAEVYAMP